MDSLTDTDLDRIFVRIQQQIDLKNISSQGELKSAIANHAKNWNNTLNSFYWERIKDERDEVLSSVQGTDDYEDLEKIKRQAESNEVIDATTISFVNKKIDRIQREEVRKQEREIAKEEAEKF